MEELAAFLAARLGEDMAAAKGWVFRGTVVMLTEGEPTRADAEYLARFSGNRVLREAEVKCAILTGYQIAAQSPYDLPEGIHDGRDDSERLRDEAIMDAMETVVRTLVTVYSDHPDYQEEWAP
jgi:hypothetical protein